MDPILIAKALEVLADLVSHGMELYAQGKATMSAEDLVTVHAALLRVQLATNALRPQVDAALDAASKK